MTRFIKKIFCRFLVDNGWLFSLFARTSLFCDEKGESSSKTEEQKILFLAKSDTTTDKNDKTMMAAEAATSSGSSSSDSSSSSNIEQEAQSFVDRFNADYEAKHAAFERQFWGTKMNLASSSSSNDNNDNNEKEKEKEKTVTYSPELLSKTKGEMEDLLSNPQNRLEAERLRQAIILKKVENNKTKNVMKMLDIIIRTCTCYDMSSSPQAKQVRDETSKLESALEMSRNRDMKLGYTLKKDSSDSGGVDDGVVFYEMSSVALRNVLTSHDDEATRQAAYEGLRSIGPFVLAHGFVDIVKKRNEMAQQLGYVDYYDYKVTQAEGFGKDRLFAMIDTLEQGTRPIMEKARQELVERFGVNATEPWNTSYKMAGSIVKKMDPYFSFSKSVERYLRSYAKLGISYANATMNLDLLDRPGKYSNGFCHWPSVAWIKPDGSWQPSVTNFTSLADPTAIGSGYRALQTLFHEAGHAAHFANIRQPSPLFSQERAPSSVAYCELQSMFLDSIVSDAAWRATYAINDATGERIPFALLEDETRATHPFAVFSIRAMLCVSYFEKALYELPAEQVTAERILALADEFEIKIQGGLSSRPLLSIPHLVSDEASCYYHGYTLAEMSVHQTRAYILQRDGYICDNPQIGPTLRTSYWECGNARPFLELVHELTGKELSGQDWVATLNETVDDKVVRQKKEYDTAIAAAAAKASSSSSSSSGGGEEKSADDDATLLDSLEMTVKFVDGDVVIADSSLVAGGILGACQEFEKFVEARVAAAGAAANEII
jgi:oligoendopeptidase F